MILILAWLVSATVANNEQPDMNSGVNLLIEMDNLYLAESTSARFAVDVNRPDFNKTVNIEWFSHGRSNIFLKVDGEDQNLNVLKVGKELFYYYPDKDKTAHINQTGALRRFFKSEFSRDDFLKVNRLAEEYHVTKTSTERYWVLELIPKMLTPIVWDKIVITIDRALRIPVTKQYFDEKGRIAKTLHYSNPVIVGSRLVPTIWQMKSHRNKGYHTTIEISDLKQNQPFKPYLFTFKNLKNLLEIEGPYPP